MISRRALLYTLLLVAAAARLLMHMAAMPPYAGLDEIQHVARLVFVMQEGRNPTTREMSVAPYLDASMHQRPDGLPSFSQIGEHWPDVVRANPLIVREKQLGSDDLRPYLSTNYQAQHPSLYYIVVAPLGHLMRMRTAAGELRIWRAFSLVCAIVIVLASAAAGEALFGSAGIVAASLLLFLPTWMTLVMRVSNDALACALVATAFALTAMRPKRSGGWILEGLLWGAAAAVKLYTWPIAVCAAFIWWRQRAPLRRVAVATAMIAFAVALTLGDLHGRTGNALGVVAFDRPGTASYAAATTLGEIVRVTIASAAWTSGQHWDALRPGAIALYLGPIFLLLGWFVFRRWGDLRDGALIAAVVLLAFTAAQAFNALSCILARRAGNPVPVGGKEGWYWYAVAPIVISCVVAPLISRWRATASVIAMWLALWDLLITEGALFHDYAGATSPLHPSALFRWGPLLPVFTARLEGIGVGPLAGWTTLLRLIQLAALFALFVIGFRGMETSTPRLLRV